MRDIGKSRRKSERKDMSGMGGNNATLRATDSIAAAATSEEADAHQDMALYLCRSLSDEYTREPLSSRSAINTFQLWQQVQLIILR